MVYFRNTTSHLYSEEKAEESYHNILAKFYPELRYIQIQMEGAVVESTGSSQE